MKLRDIYPYCCIALLMALLPMAMLGAPPRSVLLKYNESSPLLVVVTNNNAPYEFSNGVTGKPDGYDVELIMTMLDYLRVPYKITCCEWSQLVTLFEQRKVHLVMVPDDVCFEGDCRLGHANLAPVRVAAAYRIDQEQPIGQEEFESVSWFDKDYTIYVPQDGSTMRKALAAGIDSLRLVPTDPVHALSEISSGERGYLLWNELSLRQAIRDNGFADIEAQSIGMASNIVRFCSYDSNLVNILDEEFARMNQRGDIEDLQNKWFYPDRRTHDISTIAYALLAIAIIALVVVAALNRVIMVRTHYRARRMRQATNMMRAAIRLDGRAVISFDFSDGMARNMAGDFLPPEGLMPEQYLDHVAPDDRPLVYAHMRYMSASDSDEVFTSPVYRWSATGAEDGPWRTVMLQSIFERSAEGKRVRVVSTISDITEELQRSREEEESSEMFYKIFDNAVLGMAIYSPDGDLLEGNRRMYEIFHIPTDKKKGGGYFFGNNLYKKPSLIGVLDRVNPQKLWVCTRINPGDWNKQAFIELHITPVRDQYDKLIFLLVSVRDITDIVNTYRQHKQERMRLQQANEQLHQRENELRILLQTARMRLWTLSECNQTISFNSSPGSPEKVMTWDEFLSLAGDEESRSKMERLLHQDPEVIQAASVQVAMNNLLSKYDSTQWYAFNVLGHNSADENGERPLFGLALNVTAHVKAQRIFEAEKQRATESEHQKTVFLNSMAHEIRTPLNSIVGFSEVLPMLEAAERELIINTIKENCDKLLRLTDDILTISAMDAKELKLEYKDIDFARAFDKEFEHLRIYIDQNQRVEYLKDNPCDTLMAHIDMRRVSQILTNFLCNAVKYTSKGFIRLGYSCDGIMLHIYCQDTGSGISKDRQKYVFERFFQVDTFVQGTGMGLAVCKAIAEAMGGHIGVESEDGKGSIFYVDIPIKGGGK